MCPASEHTDCIRGYMGSNSSSSVSSSFGRDRDGGGGNDDGDGDGNDDEETKKDDEVAGGGCPWTCTLRTTLCAYTGSLICAGTSG